MLTVVTPASSSALVSLEVAKSELEIPADDTSQDEKLRRAIARASAMIARHCNRVFAREQLRQTFRPMTSDALLLARSPATVTAVTSDGQPLTGEEWELDQCLLYRLRGGCRIPWFGRVVVVDYAAGYRMPEGPQENEAPELPLDLEQACLQLLTFLRESAGRDPMLRSLSVPEAISQSWLDPRAGAAQLPPQVAEAVAPYVRHVFA
ncbi:hypothetical protein HMPREF9946_02574 [Acetobacteraceae bacterium AT-5844]|nr:hypothetical protein HMPREF9946_02574 [Acetobacteraceae bacterium AT-5844]